MGVGNAVFFIVFPPTLFPVNVPLMIQVKLVIWL